MKRTSLCSRSLIAICLQLSFPAAAPAQSPPAAAPGTAPGTTPGDKAMRPMFDVPATHIGPGMDSLKRQLSPVDLPARENTPQPAAAAPAAKENVLKASLRELKRLNKDAILASATGALAVYVLDKNERTIVMDFPNALEQARTFGRIVLFVERAGTPRTRVMTVPEVRKWLTQSAMRLETLTMGNNIRTSELARFFNTARLQNEPLTVDEQRLYDWLLDTALLQEEGHGVSVVPPEVIVVSVPQVSTVDNCAECSITLAQRDVALQHELAHARFAIDTAYQTYVLWFWSQVMNAGARKAFTQFLIRRGYDGNNRELLANEMQAFLMHTPDPDMFSAAAVGLTPLELDSLRQQFQAGLFPRPAAVAESRYQLD